MRHLYFTVLFLILFVAGCSNREPVLLLDGYEMGFSDSVNYTFHYIRYPMNDTVITRFENSILGDTKYITETSFNGDKISNVRKFRVDNKKKELIQQTVYFRDSKGVTRVEFDIIVNEPFTRDRYTGGRYEYQSELSNNTVMRIEMEEKFEKDTTYVFNGKALPAMKFVDILTRTTFPKYLPFMSSTSKANGYVIFAKGVGIVHYKLIDKTYGYEQKLLWTDRNIFQGSR